MGWRVKGLLIGIFVVGVLLRLRGITNPLLDDQGWRQADTASMAFNMLGHLGNFPDVLFPMLNYDGVEPQKVELEFPFLPYLLAWTWTIFGWSDVWGRIWAILFSLATIWGIFEFGRRAFSLRTGVLAVLFYAVIPLTVYYGRVVMPEPVSQAFSIWALVAVLIYQENPSRMKLVGSALLMAAAILAKLPQLMLFPVALGIGFWSFRGKALKGKVLNTKVLKALLGYSFWALFPPMLYYSWVHFGTDSAGQFVSGILTGQVVENSNVSYMGLQRNLREGIGFPLFILAGIGWVRVLELTYNLFNENRKKARQNREEVQRNQKEERQIREEARQVQGRKQGIFWGLNLWVLIGLLYLFIVCARISLDYYLVPLVLPVVLFAALAFDYVEEIPAGVIGVLVVSLLLLKTAFLYEPKYDWKDSYLLQASWLREHTQKEDVLILSSAPPMTLYYAQRYGLRLIDNDDALAWERLQKTKGDYLVILPDSRGEEFCAKVRRMYIEVGPGVYRI